VAFAPFLISASTSPPHAEKCGKCPLGKKQFMTISKCVNLLASEGMREIILLTSNASAAFLPRQKRAWRGNASLY